MENKNVNIPTIRGRIADRLKKARPRNQEDIDFGETIPDILTTSSQELGTLTLALLLLEQIREHGGTRAPKRHMESLLKRLLSKMDARQIMDLEVEAYEILLWFGSAIDPDLEPASYEDPREIDPTAGHTDLIRWAIASGEDLNMSYYTHGRGEVTSRRITPLSIEAETYVHAYCQLRREERVFRLSRIAELEPTIGWARVRKKMAKYHQKSDTHGKDEKGKQTSLFE